MPLDPQDSERFPSFRRIGQNSRRMRFQSPRGTEDVVPTDSFKWQRLESTFRDLVTRYGYGEIRTTTFEETALFTRSAGETSDIVTKEMYTFPDKGGRS